MKYDNALEEGVLLRRYQRFLAEIERSDGCVVNAHVPNTGSLLGCMREGARVWMRAVRGSQRKCPYSWEQVEVGETRVGINTNQANGLVGEAIDCGLFPELSGYASRQAEVSYGSEGSRIDWLLTHPDRPPCYLEVKNVTAAVSASCALFPDAPSERARKHLRELIRERNQGSRAVLVYCVQRADVDGVQAARSIDPAYAGMLEQARSAGVEVLAAGARLDSCSVTLVRRLAVD